MPFQAVLAMTVRNVLEICLKYAKEGTTLGLVRMDSTLRMSQSMHGLLFWCHLVRIEPSSYLFVTTSQANIDAGVTPAQAAVATDAVTTAYHAIHRRGEVKSSETVFLFGLGGLGFNALQIVHAIGARIIVSDIREERLQEAKALGIPEKDIVPVGKLPQEFVAENGLSGKIDTVLDFVGAHQTFEDAQHIGQYSPFMLVGFLTFRLSVRRGGKLLCIGSLETENTIHMKIGTRKRLSFIFSYGGQVRDLKLVLNLIANKVIQPQVETRTLKDFPTALQDLGDGNVKGRVALLHK